MTQGEIIFVWVSINQEKYDKHIILPPKGTLGFEVCLHEHIPQLDGAIKRSKLWKWDLSIEGLILVELLMFGYKLTS